jgi:hypothetical protein
MRAFLGLVLLTACGGTVAAHNGDGGTDGGNGNPCAGMTCPSGETCVAGTCTMMPPNNMLPPDPGGPPPDGSGPVVLAIHKVYLGDTDRNLIPSYSAWKSIGLNIDGVVTGPTDTNVCTPFMGANRAKSQTDGVDGIDNSWGASIIPLIMGFAPTPSKTASDQVNTGAPTMVFTIDKLGAGANYSPVTGAGYRTAKTMSMPTWDPNDARDVDSLSVTNGDLQMPLMAFTKGYVSSRVFVGEPATGEVPLEVFLPGQSGPPPPTTHVQVLMTVDPSNTSATQGTISGVIQTQALVTWIQEIAGRIQKSFCSGSAFASIAMEIQQASDIVIEPDGSVDNRPGVACNAISMGMGFDATAVKLGNVVQVPAAPNPCQ